MRRPSVSCIDVLGDARKRLLGVRQQQEVVEIDAVMARPGEILGEERGLVAGDERFQAPEMLAVEGAGSADRQPDAMQRDGITFADGAEVMVRRPALTHVVLGMNLEPADIWRGVEDRAVMLGLESGAGAGRERHSGLAVVWAPRRHTS